MLTFENLVAGSTVLITGGTGSFGSTFARHLLTTDVGEIRLFSRDEFKQDKLRKELGYDKRVHFIIGDVRNYESVKAAMVHSHFVFHAAAMKQVPSCEDYPFEAVNTNIIGSMNVIRACKAASVDRCVFLSTDKAVMPVNAMGCSKMMMEKIVLAEANSKLKTIWNPTFTIVRYGNVLMTRGSVIPLFLEQLKLGNKLTITDPTMTRFLLSLDDAIDLVKTAFVNGASGDLFVKKAPAATVRTIASAVLDIFNGIDGSVRDVESIGVRPGEKIHEVLMTAEEGSRAEEYGKNATYYRVLQDTTHWKHRGTNTEDYTSENTDQLSVAEVKDLLLTNREFLDMTKGML